MSAYDAKTAGMAPASGLVSSAQAAAAFTTESNNPTSTSSNKLLQYQLMRDIIANASDDAKGFGADANARALKTKAIDKLLYNNLKYELATIGLIDKNPQFRRIMGDDPSKIEQFSNLLRAKAIEKEIDEMVSGTVDTLIDDDAAAGKLITGLPFT